MALRDELEPSGEGKATVLVLDDEWTTLEVIRRSLVNKYHVEVASRPDEALNMMKNRAFDVVLTDVRMPDRDGLSLVREMKQRFPHVQYILMTAFSDIEDTIRAIRLGVSDYLRKPFTMVEVHHALNRCLEQKRMGRAPARPRLVNGPGGLRIEDIRSHDPAMRRLLDLAATVAPTDVTVLIGGETGTGKSMLARAIHNSSHRAQSTFTEINCAAIPEQLIESELFGHEKGSFTGAVARKIGRIEATDGGTLLLDEVGEMSLDMQSKLLRFLQEFAFERVGGTKRLTADVRVIAATNRDLRLAVRQGRFREDLYYRLHVIEMHIPPLRQRRQDAMELARAFLERFAAKYDRDVRDLGPGSVRSLEGYAWPGNVRELEHAMERAVILCRGTQVEKLDVGQAHEEEVMAAAPKAAPQPVPAAPLAEHELSEYLEQCEKQYLEGLLTTHRGRIGRVAEAAGINPKTLYLKMNRLGLDKRSFRGAAKTPRREGSAVS